MVAQAFCAVGPPAMEKLALLGRLAFFLGGPTAFGLVIVKVWESRQEELAETLSRKYPGHQMDKEKRAHMIAILKKAADTKQNLTREKMSWDK